MLTTKGLWVTEDIQSKINLSLHLSAVVHTLCLWYALKQLATMTSGCHTTSIFKVLSFKKASSNHSDSSRKRFKFFKEDIVSLTTEDRCDLNDNKLEPQPTYYLRSGTLRRSSYAGLRSIQGNDDFVWCNLSRSLGFCLTSKKTNDIFRVKLICHQLLKYYCFKFDVETQAAVFWVKVI